MIRCFLIGFLVAVSYILLYLHTAEYLFHNIFTVCSSSLLSFHRFTVVSFKLLYLLNVVNYITLCH